MVQVHSLLGLLALVGSALATRIHVNKGCVLISKTPVCGGQSVSSGAGSVTIHARYDGNNKEQYAYPGCKLDAHWPSSYGDIYFGEDNCLHAANEGAIIDGQCCKATNGLSKTLNPYVGH